MTTQRKPKAPTPHEVDRGGQKFYASKFGVWQISEKDGFAILIPVRAVG